MKYIILCCSLCIAFFFSLDMSFAAECDYTGGDIGAALDGCLSGTDLVDATGNMDIWVGVKEQVISWTQAVASFFGLIAVGAIVYGGFLMTISGGEDDKLTKGKQVIKWALLWFLALIFTSAIIRITVELIFAIAS